MSQKIRVASLFRSLATGGDENRVLAFTRALDRDRFEHSVITAVPAGAGEGGPMLAEYRAAGVQVIELDDGRLVGKLPGGGAMTAARVTLRLAALLRERRVDVLDARLAAAIPLAVLAGRLAGTPVIVGTQYHFQGWDRPARRALARAAWPRLDALICDSRARLEELLAFVPRPPRGALIPNGIDPPQSAKSRREARRALGLPEQDGVRVIGQVSRLMRFKGHLVLLDAAREVLARAPQATFLICGFEREPGYREELRARARALGIADRVRITGYPGPIGDVWRAIDVHVHASLFDSSPIAILEGMSLGKPAVVTAVGGIPELVESGATGIVVPPGDAGMLAAGVLRLLERPGEAARLGAAARLRHARRHRPRVMARAIEALFEELVRGARARRGGGDS
ncbi:MAG: glycosyltransferase [Polyangiaceae bacterium]|nr:glycosyltransferase [Polyangiaceae bacterium]